MVAAFDAGNLEPVAVALREKYPDAQIAILADNDHQLPTNVGVEKATAAAKAVKGQVFVPAFSEGEKERGMTDFNDMHAAYGLERVRSQVERAVERCSRMREEGHSRKL